MTVGQRTHETATSAITMLAARRLSVCTAESVTGGLVAAALTSVPGASATFRGAIVAYTADAKASLLGVPAALLDRVGTVHPDVAVAMARGAADQFGADAVIATTGVAGPDRVDDHPVGRVHIAVIVPGATSAGGPDVRVRHCALAVDGTRDQIREQTVLRALTLLVTALTEDNA
jgi:nicotinamide-nucleotide amidase